MVCRSRKAIFPARDVKSRPRYRANRWSATNSISGVDAARDRSRPIVVAVQCVERSRGCNSASILTVWNEQQLYDFRYLPAGSPGNWRRFSRRHAADARLVGKYRQIMVDIDPDKLLVPGG